MKISTIAKLSTAPLALSVALVGAPALAQDNDGEVFVTQDGQVVDPDANTGDAIIVTGSRIRGVELDGPSPVQVFDEDLIEARGSATLQDFLFQSNIAGPGLFNETATLSQSSGSAFFDSRGFGSGYTLVLLNGRRLPATPITGEQGTDLNQLPLAAVSRVEYLSDGASAIYGSDAIAGVLNIITKRDYNGVSLNARVGANEDGHGFNYRASGVLGTSFDRGSALVSAEVFHRRAIEASDRPYINSASAPEELGGEDGRSPIGDLVSYVDFGTGVAIANPDCPADRIRPSSYVAVGTECAFDFAPLYQVNPETTRIAATAFAEYDILDNLNVYIDARYGRSLTLVRNGAAPAFFQLGAGEQGNPFTNDDQFVYALRRITDGGPRSRDATTQSFSVATGFEAPFADNHTLTGYVQSSWVDQNQLGISGQIRTSALQQAVADGLYDITNPNNPQDVIDAISVTTFREGNLQERVFNLGMNGLFFLGGLDLGYAVGGEIRSESYTDKSDAVTLARDIAGGAGSDGEGDRLQKAVYGELSVNPLDILQISLAGRYDDIEAAGNKLGDEFTYKVAASLSPVDALTIRGSYGTGFKAPSLGELFLGQSFGVTRAIDTKVCNAAKGTPQEAAECRTREIRSIGGGNPNLAPETSRSINGGVIFQPNSDIRLSVDYWNIKVDGKIGSLGVQEILNNEDIYPDLVVRVGGRLSDPNNSYVLTNLQNLTQEKGQGLDLVASYTPLVGPGELIVDLRASYLISFKRQSSALQPLCEDAGTTSEPEWRANGRLGYETERVSANLTARYIGKTQDIVGGRLTGTCDPNDPSLLDDVDDYLEFGLNFGYDLNDTVKFTFGVENLFDVNPPLSSIAAGGWPWYDQALYTNFGRSFYAGVGFEF